LKESSNLIDSVHLTESAQLIDSREVIPSIQPKISVILEESEKLEATSHESDSSLIVLSPIFAKSSPGHETMIVAESSSQDSSVHFRESAEVSGNSEIADSPQLSFSVNIEASGRFAVTLQTFASQKCDTAEIDRSSELANTALNIVDSSIPQLSQLENSAEFPFTTRPKLHIFDTDSSIIQISLKFYSTKSWNDFSEFISPSWIVDASQFRDSIEFETSGTSVTNLTNQSSNLHHSHDFSRLSELEQSQSIDSLLWQTPTLSPIISPNMGSDILPE
jgi:hypothetical protein